MKILKLKIVGISIDEIVNYLAIPLSFDYENHTSEMSIFASEEFYFRNSSTQLNLIITKVKDSIIYMDIIGGAGGSGLFNINWGSEKGYIKKVRRILEEHRNQQNYSIEEL